ncbi:uncharacterized protein [Amphiura filiformis]|uniref:uncharacterized protein n=1 Tax=Amphiura filiformis TaxID=82378 RepID=UPI003B20C6D3
MRIANICSVFMLVTTDTSAAKAKTMLRKYVSITNTTFEPLFEARDLEASGEICDWAIRAQEMVASIPYKYQRILNITSQLYPDEEEFIRSKPSVVKDKHGDVLASATAKVYLPFNPIDFSKIKESADQIMVKTKNQKSVERVLGNGTYGHMRTCREINQEALRWALRRASSEARNRYITRGRDMLFGKDREANGFKWLLFSLEYEYTAEGDLVVTSTSLYTDPDYLTPRLAGMYYCKLLSPYRAMEWIYVDSLKPYNP